MMQQPMKWSLFPKLIILKCGIYILSSGIIKYIHGNQILTEKIIISSEHSMDSDDNFELFKTFLISVKILAKKNIWKIIQCSNVLHTIKFSISA